MRVDAMLCDFAEVAGDKLFITGAGINVTWVSGEPPHLVSVSVAAVVQVPYTSTNQEHELHVALVTEDGVPVQPWVPPGVPPEDVPVVESAGTFTVGRPTMLVPGEAQVLPWAAAFQLPLTQLGGYAFVVSVDGQEESRLPLRLAPVPASAGGGMGTGPATPGPIG